MNVATISPRSTPSAKAAAGRPAMASSMATWNEPEVFISRMPTAADDTEACGLRVSALVSRSKRSLAMPSCTRAACACSSPCRLANQ